MPVIHLKTYIEAPIAHCFDLSRSIDLHQISTSSTEEKAIAGVTSGLIGLGESVTWQAVHFGIRQKLTTKITALDAPQYFVDEMVSGAFKSIRHEHHFHPHKNGTLMEDVFDFEAPLGWLGQCANHLFLTKYMTRLLEERNAVIKAFAEGEEWRKILN